MSRHLFVHVSAIIVVLAVCGRQIQAGDFTTAKPTLDHSIVVRMSTHALNDLLARKVDRTGAVDMNVLESRAIGTSRTEGSVTVCPDEDNGLVIHFVGQTQSKTVGRAGLVTIDSRSTSDFHCVRRIAFDPRVGFVPGSTSVDSKTSLEYDQIRPVRSGLGRRIISRVAHRRAAEAKPDATRIVRDYQRRRLIRAFDREVEARLAVLNRAVIGARYASVLMGLDPERQFTLVMSPDGLELAMGSIEASGPFVRLPGVSEESPPLEIWIHSSIVGANFSSLAPLATVIAKGFIGQLDEHLGQGSVATLVRHLIQAGTDLPSNNTWVRLALGDGAHELPHAVARPSFDDLEPVGTLSSEVNIDIPSIQDDDIPGSRIGVSSLSDDGNVEIIDLTPLIRRFVANR